MIFAILVFLITCYILVRLLGAFGLLYRHSEKSESRKKRERSPLGIKQSYALSFRCSIQERLQQGLPIEVIGPDGEIELLDGSVDPILYEAIQQVVLAKSVGGKR